jgi:hypothetical protein
MTDRYVALRAAQTGWRSLDIHLMQWVDLFYPFTAVELPRIPRELETHIAPVLHELTSLGEQRYYYPR